jgi:hypothetical protein
MIGHILLALLLQLGTWIVWRSWGAGAAVASAWAISREITQAEYRWIELFGHGLRADMPWWGRFDVRVWQHADPWLDWIVPSAVTVAIALVAAVLRARRAAA